MITLKSWKILFTIAACIISIIFIASPTITLNQYKSFAQRITGNNQLEIKTLGDVTLNILPLKLVFHNIILNYKSKNLMIAQKMEIPLSIWGISSISIIKKFDEITFSNGVFSIQNLQRFLNESDANLQTKLGLKKLYLRNFSYSYEKRLVYNEAVQPIIKSTIIKNNGSIYDYRSEIIIGNDIVKSNTTIDRTNPDKIVLTADITSKYFNISVYPDKAKTDKHKGHTHLNHKLSIIVNDLRSIFSMMLSDDIENINYQNKNTNFDKNKSIGFKYESDFIVTSDFISIESATIKSPVIENFDSSIAIKIAKNHIEYYIDVSADKIDLSDLYLLKNNVPRIEKLKELIHHITITNFNLTSLLYTTGISKISVKELKTNDLIVELLKLEAIDLPDIIYFTTIEGKLAKNIHLNCNAKLINTPIHPQLDAEIYIKTIDPSSFSSWLGLKTKEKEFVNTYLKNATLNSKIYIVPFSISLEKFDIKSQDNHLFGRANLTKGAKQNMNFYLFLNGDKMDFNSLAEYYDHYLNILYNSDYDPTGEVYYNSTNNHNWLRKIKNRTCLNLNLKQALFKNIELKNFYTDIIVESGNFEINSLRFNSDPISADIKLKFSLPLFRPYINSSVYIKDANYNGIKKFIPNFEIKKNNFNFFSASQYDGHLNFDVTHLLLDDKTSLKNLKFKMKLLDGAIDIHDLEYDIFDGRAKMQTNIYLNDGTPQITAAFSTTNINPKKLFDSLWSIKNISGYTSFVGLINTVGATEDNIINNMNGQINFSCKGIKWMGIDLDEMIKITDYPTQGTIEHKIATLNYNSQYGDTYFDSIRGMINLDNGIAKINKTIFTNSRLSGSYTANVDINQKEIKSLMQVSFIPMGQYRPLNILITNNGSLNKQKRNVNMKEIFTFLNYDPEAKKQEEEKMRQSKVPIRGQIIYFLEEARKNQLTNKK